MNRELAFKIIFPIVVSIVTATAITDKGLAVLNAEVKIDRTNIHNALRDINTELNSLNEFLRENND